MKLRIPSLRSGDSFPEKYTCDGENTSPPLIFEDVPEEARSLGIVMLDPNIEYGVYTHWLVWDLSPDTREIPEGISPGTTLEDFPGSVQGRNSKGNHCYTGPCPPEGEQHNYFLTLFALEKRLDLAKGSNRQDVRNAMRGHALNSSRFHTFYRRGKETDEARSDEPESGSESNETDEPKGRILDDFS